MKGIRLNIPVLTYINGQVGN